MSEYYIGTVESVDIATNTASVRLATGRRIENCGYVFPFFDFVTQTGVISIPKPGMKVRLCEIQGKFLIDGYVFSHGKFDTSVLPGELGIFGTKSSYILFAKGAISARVSPACGIDFYPDINMLEIFSEKLNIYTDLGKIKFGKDRFGANLQVTFEDTQDAVPAGDIIKVSVSSQKVNLFKMTLTRDPSLTVEVPQMASFKIDRTGTLTIESKTQLIMDSIMISIGKNAVEPAVLGQKLVSILQQMLSAMIGGLPAAATIPQNVSPYVSQLSALLPQLPMLLSKKVKIE